MVERDLAKVDVAGSTPVSRSRNFIQDNLQVRGSHPPRHTFVTGVLYGTENSLGSGRSNLSWDVGVRQQRALFCKCQPCGRRRAEFSQRASSVHRDGHLRRLVESGASDEHHLVRRQLHRRVQWKHCRGCVRKWERPGAVRARIGGHGHDNRGNGRAPAANAGRGPAAEGVRNGPAYLPLGGAAFKRQWTIFQSGC